MTTTVATGQQAPAAVVQDPVIAAVDNDQEYTDEGAAPDSLSDADLDAIINGKGSETVGKPAEVVEPAVVPDPNADPSKITVSKEEFEQLKKKIEHQELFIQRQGNEVGQLRKLKENLLNVAKEKRAKAEEQMLTDPTAALDTHAEAREAEKQAAGLETQEHSEATRTQLLHMYPDYESKVNDIAETALEMGINPQFIENYRRNPYGTPVETMIPYIRAAVLRNLYFAKEAEIQQLKAQLGEAKNKTNTMPQKIREAALRGPAVKANGGSSAPTAEFGNITEDQIADLSYADLEKLLKTK